MNVVNGKPLLRKSRKKRLIDEQGGCYSRDRISNLPDFILHDILSFLPTKHAVRSCILSTRWKHLWTSTHNLDFCDSLLLRFTKFQSMGYLKKIFDDFVHKVLLLNCVRNIHKFSLVCKECDASHFNEWISNISTRKVQELNVAITHNRYRIYPQWLFTCESLRILKIEMDDIIEVPASIYLPNLKVLHLRNISFSADQSVNEHSLSCPILEDCVLYNCSWNIKAVNISAPILQVLTIDDGNRGLYDSEIKIQTQNLKSLKMDTGLSHEYSFAQMSSLVDARIYVHRQYYDYADRLGSLFSRISNVRDLTINTDCMSTLALPPIVSNLQSFSRLICLRVWHGSLQNIKSLIELLCYVPNIESLHFPAGIYKFLYKQQGRIMGTTPQQFLSHLKLVELTYFSWTGDQLWFVKFLMKSVRNMEILTIKLGNCPKPGSEWNRRVTTDLESLSKSSNCVLEYTPY